MAKSKGKGKGFSWGWRRRLRFAGRAKGGLVGQLQVVQSKQEAQEAPGGKTAGERR
jgi:hypothetical protein